MNGHDQIVGIIVILIRNRIWFDTIFIQINKQHNLLIYSIS
jgi:hypothetical protein